MWVVMVRKRTADNAHVWLSEIRRLQSGAFISTGRRTPRLTYDFRRGSLDNLVDRLERAVSYLLAESLVAASDEILLVAGELAERLHDVIVDNGGDEGE